MARDRRNDPNVKALEADVKEAIRLSLPDYSDSNSAAAEERDGIEMYIALYLWRKDYCKREKAISSFLEAVNRYVELHHVSLAEAQRVIYTLWFVDHDLLHRMAEEEEEE